MDFKVLGRVWNVETIAVGNAIREIKRLRRVDGTKHTASAHMSSRSKITSTKRAPRPQRQSFVLCVRNGGYEASLERRKLYRTIADPEAAANDQIRVIDESGDDYLFPKRLFVALELPPPVRRALA